MRISSSRQASPSPSGGRYSILNRDFSLKNGCNNNNESAKIGSQLWVNTGGHDQVDFQVNPATHFGNELLKEANQINGDF